MSVDTSTAAVKRLVVLERAYNEPLWTNGTHWDGCEESHVYCLLAKLSKASEALATERDAERQRADAAEARLKLDRDYIEEMLIADANLQAEVARLQAQVDGR